MQTITLAHAPTVRPLAPRSALRDGYRNILAACGALGNSSAGSDSSKRLMHGVEVELRGAIELVLLHPTLATLSEAFDAVDEARGRAQSAAKRMRRTARAGNSGKMELALAGMSAGLALLELGLEGIELLPAQVADYPWEQSGGAA